ncbi:MAG: hypothetical protein KGV57_02575 [Fusobacterium sp.]|nr:hypothetical protein [Fusobacterium sp.]
MDIWEKLYLKAKENYHPEEISPFVYAHNVVCALESESGEIFTGFCVESCCGVLDLCAERVAALNMLQSGEKKIKRIITFKDKVLSENKTIMPCGACREFLMQLDYENKNLEIMLDYKNRKTITLAELTPNWWGNERYNK